MIIFPVPWSAGATGAVSRRSHHPRRGISAQGNPWPLALEHL